MKATAKELHWLEVCAFAAERFSTCSKRQYWAVIIERNGRVVSTGYNGGPSGMKHCNQGGCPRFQQGSEPGSDYSNCIAIHAEANALMWSDRKAREGGTLIVNGPPCQECGRLIAGSGIARVVYRIDESYAGWPSVEAFLHAAGVTTVGH